MNYQKTRKSNRKTIWTKMVSIMLIFMLALSTSVTAYAAGITGLTSATLEGIMMSKERFVETYASMHRANIERSTFETCALDMDEIAVSGETLSFSASLYQGNSEEITFEVGGTLYSGYKNQIKEMNSVIVDAKTDCEDVSVLLFEMLFDLDNTAASKVNAKQELNTYDNCFMTTEPIVTTASVRLYLCIDDVIYMFEDALPTIFNQCNQKYQQMSDPMKDMLWFASLITPTIAMEKVSETDEMFVEATASTRASDAGSVFWAGDTSYVYRFDVYGERYVQRSMPFGYYRICDVATSDSTWKAEFYICESTNVGGEIVTGVDNLIRYKNVQISMAVGKGTEFSSSEIDGCSIIKKPLFQNNELIVDILSASVDWWDLGVSIVNVFDSLSDTGENVCLGTEFSSLYPSGTTAISSKIHYSRGELYGDGYSSASSNLIAIDSSSHYLILHGSVHSNLSGAVNTINTTGCIQFEWDVFVNSTLEDLAVGETCTFTGAYTVSH